MKYDEFLTKLRQTVAEFRQARGKEPTVQALAAFVEARVLKPRSKGLRSLKGLGL